MVPLGTITVTAGTSRNNHTTAIPFSLQGYAGIEVRTTGTDVFVSLTDSPEQGATAAAATGYPLAANIAKPIAYTTPQGAAMCTSPCLACFSTAGATVQVWGVWS